MISEKSTITIKRELPVVQCEICHQADCFTPETNVCTRCLGLPIPGKSVPVVHSTPVFETLSLYQRQARSVKDRIFGAILALPVSMVVIGWFFENDDKTILWWKIAYGLSVLLLIYAVVLKREDDLEGIDGFLLFANMFISVVPIGLLLLFFFIVFLNRCC